MSCKPWGEMTYLEYKKNRAWCEAYSAIDQHSKKIGIDWTASCWDIPSVDFIADFNVPFIKIASASLTDKDLIHKIKNTKKPIILSTGMSTMDEKKSSCITWWKRINFTSYYKLLSLCPRIKFKYD